MKYYNQSLKKFQQNNSERHLKAQSDLANSIEYKSALLLELWTEMRQMNDEKVRHAKQVILHDLLDQNQDEIAKSVCKNVDNLRSDETTNESLSKNCPECPSCDRSDGAISDCDESAIDRSSIKEKAFKYLVTNFKNMNYEKVEKINFKEEQFEQDCVLKYKARNASVRMMLLLVTPISVSEPNMYILMHFESAN